MRRKTRVSDNLIPTEVSARALLLLQISSGKRQREDKEPCLSSSLLPFTFLLLPTLSVGLSLRDFSEGNGERGRAERLNQRRVLGVKIADAIND